MAFSFDARAVGRVDDRIRTLIFHHSLKRCRDRVDHLLRRRIDDRQLASTFNGTLGRRLRLVRGHLDGLATLRIDNVQGLALRHARHTGVGVVVAVVVIRVVVAPVRVHPGCLPRRAGGAVHEGLRVRAHLPVPAGARRRPRGCRLDALIDLPALLLQLLQLLQRRQIGLLLLLLHHHRRSGRGGLLLLLRHEAEILVLRRHLLHHRHALRHAHLRL
mmetsp:Transcript_3029/g.9181  ORF Transcript_3029/g.9181 Transcript_3029/m.9181 type:complete len:217 (-) Transcript_3029:775-1425(-)